MHACTAYVYTYREGEIGKARSLEQKRDLFSHRVKAFVSFCYPSCMCLVLKKTSPLTTNGNEGNLLSTQVLTKKRLYSHLSLSIVERVFSVRAFSRVVISFLPRSCGGLHLSKGSTGGVLEELRTSFSESRVCIVFVVGFSPGLYSDVWRFLIFLAIGQLSVFASASLLACVSSGCKLSHSTERPVRTAHLDSIHMHLCTIVRLCILQGQ